MLRPWMRNAVNTKDMAVGPYTNTISILPLSLVIGAVVCCGHVLDPDCDHVMMNRSQRATKLLPDGLHLPHSTYPASRSSCHSGCGVEVKCRNEFDLILEMETKRIRTGFCSLRIFAR